MTAHIIAVQVFFFTQVRIFVALNQSSLDIAYRVPLLLVIFKAFLDKLFLFQGEKSLILFYEFQRVLQV